jgi:hypothetical protein
LCNCFMFKCSVITCLGTVVVLSCRNVYTMQRVGQIVTCTDCSPILDKLNWSLGLLYTRCKHIANTTYCIIGNLHARQITKLLPISKVCNRFAKYGFAADTTFPERFSRTWKLGKSTSYIFPTVFTRRTQELPKKCGNKIEQWPFLTCKK